MYGILLRLDAGRQKRVGTDPLAKLLKPEVYKAAKAQRRALNASSEITSPFAPTLVRPSFYPDYFRATDIRTLYWKVRNHPDLHNLTRVFVNEDSRIVFEFSATDAATQDNLERVLKSCGHFEFSDPRKSSNTISFAIQEGSYASSQAGEVDE